MYRLGVDAQLNYKVDGQGGGGGWLEVIRAKDVTINLEMEDSDLTSRNSAGWRQRVPALKALSVEFDMVWDSADVPFAAIRTAYMNRAMIGLQILDAAGGQGPQADFMISSLTRNEPLAEGLSASVTATVMYSETAPTWIGV